jgi:dTDP-4-dehydrorhamnose reductase
MISVLVTGANCQLGRSIQDVVKEQSNIQRYFKTSSELNSTKKENIKQFFSETKYDYLINCAAYTKVDEAVKYLAEVCKQYVVVFNGTKITLYTKDDIPDPINVYETSKFVKTMLR